MENKKVYRSIIIIEAILIIFLLIIVIKNYSEENKDGLLSRKIYTGALEPKSYLITNFYPLEIGLRDYIAKNNYNVSLYVENLRNGVSFSINRREGTFPASLNKIPIAILIMQEVEKGNLELNQEIDIRKFNTTYNKNEVKLSFLLEKMVSESDNEAFRILFTLVKIEDITNLMYYYNLDAAGFYGVEKGNPELLGPKEMSNIFSSLYFSTLLEAENSEYILKLLLDNNLNIKNIAEIPSEVKLADKYAGYYIGNKKLFHDCGILYYKESRILYCIMTRDLELEKAVQVTATIIRSIYKYIEESRTNLDEYKERGYI